MGNTNKQLYNDFFTPINDNSSEEIKLILNYKIIDVDWLDTTLVNSKMFADNYFINFPEKEKIVNNMLEYYLNHKDKAIYKKTDYLCNEREKICICNTHADDFRKIYDGINYKKGEKYINWIKKTDESIFIL